MKSTIEKPKPLGRYEKDAPGNPSGMQMVVYSLLNATEICVRMYDHDSGNAYAKFSHNAVRTRHDISRILLDFLVSEKLIQEAQNWDYSMTRTEELKEWDEVENKEAYEYFAWKVKESNLIF